MITYTNVQQRDFNSVIFRLNGDGVDKVLTVNLSKPPFNINFNGVLPASTHVETNDADLAAVGSVTQATNGDVMLTLTFEPAPPESNTQPGIDFIYNSL